METLTHTGHYRDTILSRTKVEALLAQGRKIVIVDGRVLKVDAWLPYHPGGDKAILHMVGRDATDEVKAFHSAQTYQFMRKFQIGRVKGRWKDFLPQIQGGVFGAIEEQSAPVVEDQMEHDMSSNGSLDKPALGFEPNISRTSLERWQQVSEDTASETSASSSSAHDLSPPAGLPRKPHFGPERTQAELQRDLEAFPSLDPATQIKIISEYRHLDQRIRDEGLYDCSYTAYLFEILRYSVLAFLAYLFLQKQCFALSALFLGMLWHQLVFTVHDAGHMGITHDFHVDTCIGIFIANFLGGLSCCWWKRNHNVHHIVTNSAEHDPDIQHMPFFAVSHRFFENLRSTYYDRVMVFDTVAQYMLKYQHYLYYPVLTFGRFNLYALSWEYIFFGRGPRKGPAWWHRYLEIIGQMFFWYWFGYLTVYKSIPTGWDRFLFVMISHAVTMPVHAQITLSHFAMSTADLGVAESFPQRMLRTTMDVDCPPWLDFFHGGLQFQAVHHLFPRIPRHNLRKCQKLVVKFCQDMNIPYTIYGFAEGNGKVIGHLGEIAKQARILAECQRTIPVQNVLDGH